MTTEPQRATLSRRKKVALSELETAFSALLGPVLSLASAHDLKPVHSFVRYHLYAPPQPIDLEVGIIVDHPSEGDKDTQPGTLPAGKVVRMVHRGDYAGLSRRFVELSAWVKKHHLSARPGPWAIYKVTAATHPNQQDWITELYWPLADK